MKISSHHLEAFYQTAKLKSFSKAAAEVAVTQSALSQRIAKLESDLEVTLFIRDPAGLVLTTAGETLLRYCQVNQSLEAEVLGQMQAAAGVFQGTIRIAGFSSVMRSIVIPALAPFLRKHSLVNCEFKTYQVSDLFKVLKNAEADFVIMDYRLNKNGILSQLLGREEYVVVESSTFETPSNLFLDHDSQDHATELFFQGQEQAPKSLKRVFMGDVYAIIDGVELGLGRAVMSKHLLKEKRRIKQVKVSKKYFREVTLNYFEQAYYSQLQQEIVRQLLTNSVGFF